MENKEMNKKELNLEEMDRVSGGTGAGLIDSSRCKVLCFQCWTEYTQYGWDEILNLCPACREKQQAASQLGVRL